MTGSFLLLGFPNNVVLFGTRETGVKGCRNRRRKRPPHGGPLRPPVVLIDEEIETLTAEASGILRAIIVVLSEFGLRAGALPTLSITGERYICTTKGREQSGKVPEAVRRAIMRAGLPLRAPFAERTVGQIEDALRYLSGKLHLEGKITARYSAHDLRHAFALRFYRATRDVYAVKVALGHATVQVTENYLKGLGEI